MPGGNPRHGIFAIDTTRGDRLFISLLGYFVRRATTVDLVDTANARCLHVSTSSVYAFLDRLSSIRSCSKAAGATAGAGRRPWQYVQTLLRPLETPLSDSLLRTSTCYPFHFGKTVIVGKEAVFTRIKKRVRKETSRVVKRCNILESASNKVILIPFRPFRWKNHEFTKFSCSETFT